MTLAVQGVFREVRNSNEKANPFGEGPAAEAAESMYQALLDAPIPLDSHSLYAAWWGQVCRPAVRAAGKVRKGGS